MILVHHCRTCGHNELEARAQPSRNSTRPALLGKGPCSVQCSCPGHEYGPPEAVPSFNGTGRRIGRLAEPGTTLAGALTTCTCEDCKAEYQRLVEAGMAG